MEMHLRGGKGKEKDLWTSEYHNSNFNMNSNNSNSRKPTTQSWFTSTLSFIIQTYKQYNEHEYYRNTISVLKIGVIAGVVLATILITELFIMNLVSFPRDGEKEAFIYEIKHPDLWEAQIFLKNYNCHVVNDCFIKTKVDNATVSYENSLRAKYIQYQIFYSIYSHLLSSFIQFFNFLGYTKLDDNRDAYLSLIDYYSKNNDYHHHFRNLDLLLQQKKDNNNNNNKWSEEVENNENEDRKEELLSLEVELINLYLGIQNDVQQIFASNSTILLKDEVSTDDLIHNNNNNIYENENEFDSNQSSQVIDHIKEKEEEEDEGEDEEEDHVFTLLGQYLYQHFNNEKILELVDPNYNISSKSSLVSNVMIGKSNEIHPIVEELNRLFVKVEKKIIYYLTIIDEKDIQFRSLLLLSEIQKAREINQFYVESVLSVSNTTAEMRRIVDVGQEVLRYLCDQFSILQYKFQHRSMFQFGHLLVLLGIMIVWWWFKSEEVYYSYISLNNNNNNNNNQNLNGEELIENNDYGFWNWKRKSIKPIIVIVVNVCIAFAIIRTLRTISFSATIIPNSVMHCKLRKFPESVTQSASFYEKLYQFFFVDTNIEHAGCNDLIFSGHVAMYTIICICFHFFCASYLATGLVYLLACEPTIDAILKGQHYSVDVAVAIYVTILVERFVYHLILPTIVGTEAVDSVTLFTNYIKDLHKDIGFFRIIKLEIQYTLEYCKFVLSYLYNFFVKYLKKSSKTK